MVKSIHFNKEHPENHNIKIPNKKYAQIKTYNGDNWETQNKQEGIETLITNIVDRLESDYGEEFRQHSSSFIQDLWTKKMGLIMDEQKIDSTLRKQVEYITIIDGQTNMKN